MPRDGKNRDSERISETKYSNEIKMKEDENNYSVVMWRRRSSRRRRRRKRKTRRRRWRWKARQLAVWKGGEWKGGWMDGKMGG